MLSTANTKHKDNLLQLTCTGKAFVKAFNQLPINLPQDPSTRSFPIRHLRPDHGFQCHSLISICKFTHSAVPTMLVVYSAATAAVLGGGCYCLWRRLTATEDYKKPISVNYHFTRKVGSSIGRLEYADD